MFSTTVLLFTLLQLLSVANIIEASNSSDTYYVLAYSWTPEFCYQQTTYPGCQAPEAFWGKYFTLHGLWPQYIAGGYPATCTTEAFNTTVPKEVGMSDMITYWPNVKYALSDSNYDEFWEHEWTKHGTCSGLVQETYFQDAINLIKKFGTPASVTNAVGSTVSADTLRKDMGGKYLSGAYTCWSQVNDVPDKQVQCGSDVQKEDTCTSATVTVQSF